VPLVAAAVCPHPPLIVPEVAAGAAAELDDLRAACDGAVARLAASGAQTVVVLGADDRSGDRDSPYRGSFAPWGVPLTVELGRMPNGLGGTHGLPLSLLVGAWLLTRAPGPGRPTAWRMATVADDEPVGQCVDLGARIGSNRPWAVLVMGDGSACRGQEAPGNNDPRAQPYDDAVAVAMAGADASALLDLDPGLSAELKVAGRAPWQVLASAALASGRTWRGDLTYYAAPYGVAYFVACWEPAVSARSEPGLRAPQSRTKLAP
jgi:hypothetical protein